MRYGKGSCVFCGAAFRVLARHRTFAICLGCADQACIGLRRIQRREDEEQRRLAAAADPGQGKRIADARARIDAARRDAFEAGEDGPAGTAAARARGRAEGAADFDDEESVT